MILGRHVLLELAGRIIGHVDVSSETGLSLSKRRGEFGQADAADHQQIHVAERMFLTAGYRTVNKGTVDARPERLQRLPERWQQPGSFFEEAA